jgi:sugar lactone lactonase YvrE
MPRPLLRIAPALALLTASPLPASAWHRGQVHTFAVLPDGSGGPEGLEVDPQGNVYVASFGFDAHGPIAATQGRLFVYDRQGRLQRQVAIEGSSPHLLGLHLRASGKLLVADFGQGRVLEVDPSNAASPLPSTVFMTAPVDPATTSLNDITEDAQGNVYVSDSFNGVIWRTGAAGGVATSFASSDLLRTAGVPPFGANGLRFDRAGTALFVANTGDDTVVKVPATGGVDTATVFVNSVNGADGLEIDDDGNLWVVANQADEIVVLDPSGKTIAKLGDFGGAVRDGTPDGLLFPASLRLSRGSLFVTNLALDLRLFNPTFVSGDSPWTAQVTRYTVSRLQARIPGR